MASYLDDFVDVGTEETAGNHIKNDSNEWASFLEKKEHTTQVRVLTICLEKDGKYLIFNKEDAKALFEKYRIFGKFNSIYTKGTEPFERCPVEVSRIQVEMLLEQKLAKLCVRSMPENVSGVVEIPVVAPSDETILEYAVKAVKGRKAKSLKRGTTGIDETCNAKKRKVRPSDLKNIEVGETDIYAAFEELKETMLFFSFFKSLVGRDIIVELKNDLMLSGTLQSVDQYLNVKLDKIEVLDQERFPHLIATKNCFIRGSTIRYIQLNPNYVDTQILHNATRKEMAAQAAK
uniref:Sm domain-containing protein n=1 Tax=Rhabditophanes sp. KR3021 TaxID=114890 RepID=A0AC35TGG3_9BILA